MKRAFEIIDFQTVFKDFLKQNENGLSYEKASLQDIWKEVVPEKLAPYTKVSLQAQTLKIQVSSPAVRQELAMQKSKLLKELQDRFEFLKIEKIWIG